MSGKRQSRLVFLPFLATLSLFLASIAAVLWDVLQRSPEQTSGTCQELWRRLASIASVMSPAPTFSPLSTHWEPSTGQSNSRLINLMSINQTDKQTEPRASSSRFLRVTLKLYLRTNLRWLSGNTEEFASWMLLALWMKMQNSDRRQMQNEFAA